MKGARTEAERRSAARVETGQLNGARKNFPQNRGKSLKIVILVVALVAVVIGGILFVGAVSGWFSGGTKVVLDEGDYCGEDCTREFMDLTVPEYEEKVAKGDSFVLFVDQSGCYTADRLREFVLNWADMAGTKVYRMMFSEVRECSLRDSVKYYPSVVLISRGKPVAWLRADENADSDAYNFEDKFREWISGYF